MKPGRPPRLAPMNRNVVPHPGDHTRQKFPAVHSHHPLLGRHQASYLLFGHFRVTAFFYFNMSDSFLLNTFFTAESKSLSDSSTASPLSAPLVACCCSGAASTEPS